VRADYALIVGQGGSGTNWLLRLFDLSPLTFCRNEPHALAGSRLAALFELRIAARSDDPVLEREWDEAMRWTGSHMGSRDAAITVPKLHLRPLARRLGVERVLRGPRYRRALGLAFPALRGEEWPLPRLLRNARFEQALPVFKLVQTPGFAAFVLRRRPAVRVFHIVRHPGGFLNSWANRYLARNDREQVRRSNLARLEQVVREDPTWAARFGDLAALPVEDAELWYWCYANEVICQAGRGNPNYHRLIYEEVARDPIAAMRRCYAACELPWTEAIEREVLARGDQSQAISDRWRAQLPRAQVEAVERVLAGSLMRGWWDAEGG
jgi:hypothetical protein